MASGKVLREAEGHKVRYRAKRGLWGTRMASGGMAMAGEKGAESARETEEGSGTQRKTQEGVPATYRCPQGMSDSMETSQMAANKVRELRGTEQG